MTFKRTLLSLGMAAACAMTSGNALAEIKIQNGVLIHLFQWKFNDIANECEKVLGPKAGQDRERFLSRA